MSSVCLEQERVINNEQLHLTYDPAPINLHLYQPPRILRIIFENKSQTVYDISGNSNSSTGFNQKITEESYAPLINQDILANPSLSWNLYGVTGDWMSVYHPELLETLKHQIDNGAKPPVGDTYLHIIYPFLSREHKDMLLQISKQVYRERWGVEMETIWLPESAVDQDTISSLVASGIKGVHLREHQIIQPKPANIHRLATKEGEIFAITGHNHLSGIIGFDKPWADSFFRTWQDVSKELGYSPRLSIDGETLGHWWKQGDGAFGFTKYLLRYLNEGLNGQYLDHSTPQNIYEASVVDNTSWSCMDNGVGRWKGSNDCYCALPSNHQEAQKIRESKKDLFTKLTLVSTRIDEALNLYLPEWRELYPSWFLSQRNNLATGSGITASMFSDQTLERLLISAYIRDLGWTSCGWFFGDVNGFERQIPANSLKTIAQIMKWSDVIPNH